jgi:hypothetical protein
MNYNDMDRTLLEMQIYTLIGGMTNEQVYRLSVMLKSIALPETGAEIRLATDQAIQRDLDQRSSSKVAGLRQIWVQAVSQILHLTDQVKERVRQVRQGKPRNTPQSGSGS